MNTSTYFVQIDLPLPSIYGSTPENVHKASISLRSRLQRKSGFKIGLTGSGTSNPNYKITWDFSTLADAQAAAEIINSLITSEDRARVTTKFTNPNSPFAVAF